MSELLHIMFEICTCTVLGMDRPAPVVLLF